MPQFTVHQHHGTVVKQSPHAPEPHSCPGRPPSRPSLSSIAQLWAFNPMSYPHGTPPPFLPSSLPHAVVGLPTPIPVPNLQRLYFKFAPPVDPRALGTDDICNAQQVCVLRRSRYCSCVPVITALVLDWYIYLLNTYRKYASVLPVTARTLGPGCWRVRASGARDGLSTRCRCATSWGNVSVAHQALNVDNGLFAATQGWTEAVCDDLSRC